jgi:hypothetical protein
MNVTRDIAAILEYCARVGECIVHQATTQVDDEAVSREDTVFVASIRRRCVLYVIGLAIASVACAGPQPLPLPGKDRGDPREMPGATSREPRENRGQANGLDAKNVSGKVPPATLVADDGHRCIVPAPRYREVQIGERVLCAWRRGDRAP